VIGGRGVGRKLRHKRKRRAFSPRGKKGKTSGGGKKGSRFDQETGTSETKEERERDIISMASPWAQW